MHDFIQEDGLHLLLPLALMIAPTRTTEIEESKEDE
jgi:hypothetical protein